MLKDRLKKRRPHGQERRRQYRPPGAPPADDLGFTAPLTPPTFTDAPSTSDGEGTGFDMSNVKRVAGSSSTDGGSSDIGGGGDFGGGGASSDY
jgi:uncharacterized membrane protein YgcG